VARLVSTAVRVVGATTPAQPHAATTAANTHAAPMNRPIARMSRPFAKSLEARPPH